MTIVGVLREAEPGERRVALTPEGVERLLRQGASAALIETGAGEAAFFSDDGYASSGATIGSREDVYARADVVLCVGPPPDAVDLCRPGQLLIGLLGPLTDPAYV